MAVLDRYIEALVRTPGAHWITLRSGVAVEMVVAGTSRPVGRSTPSFDQIVAAIAEVATDEQVAQAQASGREISYVGPHGPVMLAVQLGDGRAAVRLRPAEAPRGPRASAPSLSGVGAPPAAPAPAPAPSSPGAEVLPPGKPRHLDELFHQMLDQGASDLHLKSGKPPYLRVDGAMRQLEGRAALARDEVWELLAPVMPAKARAEYDERKDTDFAYELAGKARMRCNVFEDVGGPGAAFRQIPTRIATARELGLPQALLKLCDHPKGLVLVTGPTGSGKSTTLAALIDHINESRAEHIITIEDPVEFVHQDKRCLINQREVGSNTRSFQAALRAALREDPDVVLVGELRDLETTAIAIETAETGHLVFGTLHTNTAASTVDRIVDQFPEGRQGQIRSMLAESLLGVVSQTLCKRKGGGRVAALEVLIVTPAVSNLVREAKIFQIPSIMQTSRGAGMQTMNDGLLNLVRAGTIEPQEAHDQSISKREMALSLTRAGFRGAWSEEGA
jgi:twitching motility protein PilT